MSERPNGLTYAEAGVDIDAGNALVERIKPAAAAHRAARGDGGARRLRRALRPARPPATPTRCWSRRPTASAPSSGSRSRPGGSTASASTSSRCASTTWSARAPSRCSSSTTSPPASSTVDAAAARSIEGIAARLRRGRRGAGRRRDRRDAGDVRRRRLRPRGLRGRRDGARRARCRAAWPTGDVLLGLASSGVHSNGFSLVRRVVEAAGLGWDAPAPVRRRHARRGAARADPHLRARRRCAALRAGGVHGLAHITGGGLTENLPRVLPDGPRRRDRPRRLGAAAGLRLAARRAPGSPRPRC